MQEVEQRNKNLARVILRSDGKVHIAFRGIRSIYATAGNIAELFSDPLDFIESKSFHYRESTFEINRKRVSLDEVLGLTLASVNSDKQIICHFPELFRYIFSASGDEVEENKPLDMKDFEFEAVLSDEKSFLLRYYLEFTNYFKSAPAIKKNIRLRDEVQTAIIREILNTFFEELPEPKEESTVTAIIERSEANHILKANPENAEANMILCSEYATIHQLSVQTVRYYAKQGRIKSAKKDERGRFWIDRNEKPEEWDLRKGRKNKKPGSGPYKRAKAGSAADVEEHIKKKRLFTEAVAPYIHTYEEMDYYVKRNYHEVCWEGRPALIIDVNPDYISSKTGKRNRDLMMEGKSPVVPDRNKEEYVFHVHHVGQHQSSPFAIIPEYDHNGKGLSAVFHQGSPKTNLHGPEFEVLKANFWKNYIKEYDKVGRFAAIPFLNSTRRKDNQ